MKKRRPAEAWLKSDDPDRYVAAAMRCQHPAGLCMQDGFCHYEDCFKPKRRRKASVKALPENAA